MKWILFLAIAAALHVSFMVSELFPRPFPKLLSIESKKWLTGESFTSDQQRLVATLVHNAAIYNGIVAGGLTWAAYSGHSADNVARVMLAGAVAAGIFGTATLKAPISVAMTVAQAAMGIIGLYLI